MLDPLVSLAFSIHANPGVYALLLGSGLSRAARIPTGWEVVLDLIQRHADLSGKDVSGDPAGWYARAYGKQPNYSEILEAVARTPAERGALLREYFEPTTQEREEGAKIPTIAHRAIADLVAGGFVRVLITTNFDRLLETALADAGITPVVLSHPSAYAGAPPLQHARCVVLKLHGDYLDTRIRNTAEELAAYEPELDGLLDRLLVEYGLVVCGWSGEWDRALRDALARCANRRYTLFWAARREPTGVAKDLCGQTAAVYLPITDADTFFPRLRDAVLSLAELKLARHPLAPDLAEATVKRHLRAEPPRIQLRDVVVEETNRVCAALQQEQFSPEAGEASAEGILARVNAYQAAVAVLASMLVPLSYYRGTEEAALLTESVVRVAKARRDGSGITVLLDMEPLPALLLMYLAGIAAVATNQLEGLGRLFRGLAVDPSKRTAGFDRFNALAVLPDTTASKLPGMGGHYLPGSDYIHRELRSRLKRYLPDNDQYDDAFDRLEYLIALAHLDLSGWEPGSTLWAPVGRFIRRHPARRVAGSPAVRIDEEATIGGPDWGLLKSGLFRGSVDRFRTVKGAFDEWTTNMTRRLG